MLIDLRTRRPVDLGPVTAALAGTPRARVVCDWVQYRENFRDVVDVRQVLPEGSGLEVAVDARRAGQVPLGELTAERLRGPPAGRVYLEDWGPGQRSCVWGFNALYWSALQAWEKATGRGYEQALPGGKSDARDSDAVRELVRELLATHDTGELYVVELGVGNGGQAKAFLDAFRELGTAADYGRLQYFMCDYSRYVLDLARETVAEHADRVSSVPLDATQPGITFGFLRGKAALLYISNVYDNLPTDEVAVIDGSPYLVRTRAYFAPEAAADLAASADAAPEELPELVRRLLRLGPSLLPDAAPGLLGGFRGVDAAVRFWQRAWSALKLEEQYAPLPDDYQVAPGVGGETLRPLLALGEVVPPGQQSGIRMHVSNGAVASFADSLRLLHPRGALVCHDLFVTGVDGYRTGFRGPGKYDGSVVNWVNGPLLARVAASRGFEISFRPFRHNTFTMRVNAAVSLLEDGDCRIHPQRSGR
jgi:hypothetical protein